MQSALKTTKKSPLALIVNVVEATEFWKECLHRYIRDSPAMLEWVPKVHQYTEQMKALQLDLKSCMLLKSMVADLHKIKANLREKLVLSFSNELNQISKDMVHQLLRAPTSQIDKELVSCLQASMTELSLNFPLDEEVQDHVQQLGALLQQLQQESHIDKLEALAKRIKEMMGVEKYDPDKIFQTMPEVQKVTAMMTVGGVKMEPATQANIVEMWGGFWLLLQKHGLKWEAEMEDEMITDLLNLQNRLASVVLACKEVGEEVCLTFFEAAVQAMKHFKACGLLHEKEMLEMVNTEGIEKMKELKRALAKIDLAKKEAQNLQDKILPEGLVAMSAFEGVHEQMTTSTSKVHGKMEALVMEQLTVKIAELKMKAGGRLDGGEWQSYMPEGQQWSQVLKLYQDKKLMDLPPVEMVNASQAVQEAALKKS